MKTQRTYNSIISSPLGKIGIACQQEKLIKLSLLPDDTDLKRATDKASQQVAKELAAYFANPRHVFTQALQLEGTEFQQRVWHAISAIPTGETQTYGALAKKLKTGPRAIGQACKTNPIFIIVPCHRVVATNDLGGYGGTKQGPQMDIKKWLLRHETQNK